MTATWHKPRTLKEKGKTKNDMVKDSGEGEGSNRLNPFCEGLMCHEELGRNIFARIFIKML